VTFAVLIVFRGHHHEVTVCHFLKNSNRYVVTGTNNGKDEEQSAVPDVEE
jgi:hypothetical protein